MEAIVLAGGLGTRLRSVVPDLPKCMAPINGIPFLSYLMDHLTEQGVSNFIFALGYKSNQFLDFLYTKLPHNNFSFVIEDEPLGTGGALKLALDKSKEENIIALNGDSLYKVNLKELMEFHKANMSNCTLALKPMQSFERYGSVEINELSNIVSFKEKKFMQYGLINGGVYAIHVASFLSLPLPTKFSLEKGYLEKYSKDLKFFGNVQESYFIDIGVPEDYSKAQIELK
jgi:D-glycero-alpha-D-manno-heptose 1-phosphate guanylyltransferase